MIELLPASNGYLERTILPASFRPALALGSDDVDASLHWSASGTRAGIRALHRFARTRLRWRRRTGPIENSLPLMASRSTTCTATLRHPKTPSAVAFSGFIRLIPRNSVMTRCDDCWAKSPRNGESIGESLIDHTRQVLSRIVALRNRAPHLASLCQQPRLWHRMLLAAALHDMGKVDPRFQQMLREPKRPVGSRPTYDQRHEVVSLSWLNWILGDDPGEDHTCIAAAIASHHRDYRVVTAVQPRSGLLANQEYRRSHRANPL